MTAQIPEQAKAALLKGSKIEAIRITREALGLGLKESKDLVEAHISSQPERYPQLKANPAALWVGVALFFAAVIGVAICTR